MDPEVEFFKAILDMPLMVASLTKVAILMDAHAGWIFPVLSALTPLQSENPPPPAVYILWGSLRASFDLLCADTARCNVNRL
jgi:hypothetical protein